MAEGCQFSVLIRAVPGRMAHSTELCKKGAIPRVGGEARTAAVVPDFGKELE